jgi:hypothetical protein
MNIGDLNGILPVEIAFHNKHIPIVKYLLGGFVRNDDVLLKLRNYEIEERNRKIRERNIRQLILEQRRRETERQRILEIERQVILENERQRIIENERIENERIEIETETEKKEEKKEKEINNYAINSYIEMLIETKKDCSICLEKFEKDISEMEKEKKTNLIGYSNLKEELNNAKLKLPEYKKIRDGKEKTAEFEKGILVKEHKEIATKESNGTFVTFVPDDTVFKNFHFVQEYLDKQFWNYCYLNAGLVMNLNGKRYVSKNGLHDLLASKVNQDEIPLLLLELTDIAFKFIKKD